MKTVLYLIGICLFLTACAPACQESALSDIVLTDPSLLVIKADFNKDINTAGLAGESVSVWVRDKNSQALSLKDGKVIVNDVELSVFKSFIGKLPYYNASGSRIPINENQIYTLDIILGDGQKYTSQIAIPEKSLRSMNCPNVHNGSEPLLISWDELSPEYTTVLSWVKKVQNDTVSNSYTGSLEIYNNKSEHEFPVSFFKEGSKKITEVEITLTSSLSGVMCSDFRSNSSIGATYTIKRNVVIE